MRKNIKLRVKNLVNKYQTADPFALAKELDVNILYVPLPEKIRGILVRVLRKKTILLNDKLNYEAQKIVICHELGHVRMHWHAGYFFQHEGLISHLGWKNLGIVYAGGNMNIGDILNKPEQLKQAEDLGKSIQ